MGDALRQASGDIQFAGIRPFFDAGFARRRSADQMHLVVIAAEGAGLRRDVVGEDPVAALRGKLRLGIGDNVVGLGGKANDQAWAVVLARRQGGQDIGIFHQLQVGGR